jgi:hypothetical protein
MVRIRPALSITMPLPSRSRPKVAAVRASPGTKVLILTTAASSSGTDCACAAVASASSIAGATIQAIKREQARRIVMRELPADTGAVRLAHKPGGRMVPDGKRRITPV